jgi:hypothetical protein
MLSYNHVVAWIQPLDEDHLSPIALERAHRFVRKSLQLEPNLPIARAHAGCPALGNDALEPKLVANG